MCCELCLRAKVNVDSDGYWVLVINSTGEIQTMTPFLGLGTTLNYFLIDFLCCHFPVKYTHTHTLTYWTQHESCGAKCADWVFCHTLFYSIPLVDLCLAKLVFRRSRFLKECCFLVDRFVSLAQAIVACVCAVLGWFDDVLLYITAFFAIMSLCCFVISQNWWPFYRLG